MNPADRLEHLINLGFDNSKVEADEESEAFIVSVSCTQCAAAVINGWPCHEHGCPNRKRGHA